MTGSKPQPSDAVELATLAQVAPADWQNPEPKDCYQLVVIGGGPAGLVAAAGAAGLGARVALVERERLGGDCLNFGCVPSKALLRAAHLAQQARIGQPFGVQVGEPKVDAERAFARLRLVQNQLAKHDSAARFQGLGVDVFFGAGRFASEDTLRVGSQRLRFRRALIATGAQPSVPSIPGLAGLDYHTNETIFSINRVPERLAVLGAGPIGCELGQAFARLGSRVYLIDTAPRVLPRDDARASEIVARQLRRDGVELMLGRSVREVRRTSDGVELQFEQVSAPVEASELLLATGRRPNTQGLELERAGIELEGGELRVDDRLSTTNPRVYAAGDVVGGLQFTHAADAMARIALQNALFMGNKRLSALSIPWVTYTSPQVAHVGLSEDAAQRLADGVLTYEVDLSELDRGVIDGEAAGYCRIHVHKKRGTLLGASMVSEHAGEAIGELALAVSQKISVAQLAQTVHAYPTSSEGWKRAADAWSRDRLTPSIQRLLRWWLALFDKFA